jgi:hypothetical protein
VLELEMVPEMSETKSDFVRLMLISHVSGPMSKPSRLSLYSNIRRYIEVASSRPRPHSV